jgi:lysophospholipase L1-like esterase
MPLGDSITQGYTSTGPRGGYRVELFRRALASGKSLNFVGSQTNGPDTVDGQPFPQHHEGHPGDLINEISGLVVGALQTERPTIVLLMIGTNDIFRGVTSYPGLDQGAEDRLASLVDKIFATSPDVFLVVGKIIPSTNDAQNSRTEAYNAAIPAMAAERAAAGRHITVVDMYAPFIANANYRTELLSDNLHPTDSGYDKMGDLWFTAIESLLP